MAFWADTLAFAVSPGVRPATQLFPRVALDWDPRDLRSALARDRAANKRMLETCVLVLFTSAHRLSSLGERLLREVVKHSALATRRSTIDCVVTLRFVPRARDTNALVDAVATAANSTLPSRARPFRWVGVRLVGCDDVQYDNRSPDANLVLFSRLCASLPPSIAAELSLPETCVLPHRTRTKTVVNHHIKKLAAPWVTRVQTLDLTYCFEGRLCGAPVTCAALCTQLPFAQSLQKLRVCLAWTRDLLWLMYAVFHPLTPTTPWRALVLDGEDYQPID